MEKLTVKEALEQGYTYYGYKDLDEQSIKKLDRPYGIDFEKGVAVLAEKGSSTYSIAGGTIRELVSDHILAQDEFSDEDAELCDLADKATLYDALADEINSLMSTKKFWFLTDIELIP